MQKVDITSGILNINLNNPQPDVTLSIDLERITEKDREALLKAYQQTPTFHSEFISFDLAIGEDKTVSSLSLVIDLLKHSAKAYFCISNTDFLTTEVLVKINNHLINAEQKLIEKLAFLEVDTCFMELKTNDPELTITVDFDKQQLIYNHIHTRRYKRSFPEAENYNIAKLIGDTFSKIIDRKSHHRAILDQLEPHLIEELKGNPVDGDKVQALEKEFYLFACTRLLYGKTLLCTHSIFLNKVAVNIKENTITYFFNWNGKEQQLTHMVAI